MREVLDLALNPTADKNKMKEIIDNLGAWLLADALQHNSTISEACRYAGISPTTYFSYMRNEVFAEKMQAAKENRNKVVFSFSTYF